MNRIARFEITLTLLERKVKSDKSDLNLGASNLAKPKIESLSPSNGAVNKGFCFTYKTFYFKPFERSRKGKLNAGFL